MIRVIALLNPFSAEKTQFETDKKSIKEILEKIDPYKAVNTGWRVLIDDVIITDFDLIPEDGQTVYIKLVPEGGGTPKEQGGAMKGGGWATIALGIAAIFIPVVGPFLGAALIGSGVGMVLGGTVLMNMDIPSLNDRESPEQSPSIRGSRNQMRQLGVIPFLFGTRRIYADLAATSYTWVDRNGDQYLYQLFCAGQKDIEIDTGTIKIADTLLADYSGGSIDRILAGADPLIRMQIASGAGTPPLVTKCVHEEQRNSQLKNKTEEGIDGSVIWTTPDNTEGINVDIFFYNGLGKYNDDGDVVSTSVRVGAWFKKATEPDSAYQILGYFSGYSDTISGSELKTKRYAIDKTGLEAGQYTVKVSRISDDTEDNNTVDAVYLGSIRAIKNSSPVSPETCKKLTLIGLKIKASEKLSNVIDQLNFVATAKMPVYSGSGTGQNAWNTIAKTENPASCALAAMQSDFAQQKLTGKEIDWPKLESWYTWCEEHNYTCNEYVAESISISQLLMAIASTSRAEVFRLNGKLTMVQDIERTAAVQLFTPRNSFGYTETIMFADIPDAMAIGFVDKEAGYAENELSIYNTKSGNKENEPDTSQDVSLWGVTDSEQARRLGMYKFAVTKNRPIVHKFSCDFEYLLCSKGDWIKYAGDIALAGLKQGRIAEVIYDNGNVTGFVADEVLPMEAGKSYAVRIRKNNAEIVLYKLKTSPGNNLEVSFEFPLSGSGLNEGDLFAFGLVDTETIDLIITDIQPGENLSADITAVEYSPAIFDVDKPDFVLPDFENKITPVPGAVDSGEISGWNTWYTYNDQKNMPDRPTGDGTANGWHRIQTAQSMWQSSKTAAKITDGTWSVPTPTGALAVDEILGGQTEIGVPDKPSRIEAVAEEKGIAVKAQINTLGLKNTIQTYIWSLNKGSEWQEIESQSSSDLIPFSKNEYPEYSDLQNWKIRLRLKNVYGKFSDYSDEVSINTDTYGTWILSQPEITLRVSGRSVSLQMTQPQRSDNRKIYGKIRHKIQIQKPSESDTWLKPATDKNPYESTDNWQDGEGFADTGDFYSQTLPLEGQDITVTEEGQRLSNPQDTLYRYRVTPYSEASEGDYREVNATALGTNVQDIVHGSVTHEAISTPNLAAISANLGLISAGGFGTGSKNFWSLSTLQAPDGKRYEGDFRVGGDNQFIRVEPIVNDREEITDYTITIQVGSFQISSTASKINGEIIVQKDENSLDRTKITPYGTYYEYRPTIDAEWITIAKQETRGLLSQLMYSDNTLILTNADINDRRKIGHDIGRPYLSDQSLIYHFDTNLLNQHQQTQCDIQYDADPPALVGREDNNDVVPIDFTPAILAVSPYSEVGKSLYGQYSLNHPIGESNTWTVDFWLQYIWAEGQVLFTIGTESDKIQILNSTGEPNYNEPLDQEPPYNTDIIQRTSQPYNVALGADNFLQHAGIAQTETLSLSEMGITFESNSWLHFAVVMTPEKITAYLNDKEVPFSRFALATEIATINLNETKNSFILDEFLVDPVTAETFDDFVETTKNKVPFGSLDWRQQWFIIDAKNTANIKTNIFESEVFRSAVKKIIQEENS